MAHYNVTQHEFDELQRKEDAGEGLTAIEQFRLRAAREQRFKPRNEIEALAARWRRGPWAKEE